MGKNTTSKKSAWIIQCLGILISIACITFIVKQIHLDEIKTAFLDFNWIYLAIGIFSLALGYTLRIIRWAVMLRAAGAAIRNAECAVPFLGSIALNNVLPLRAGDWVRAFIFPASMGVQVTTSTASLFLERFLDLLTLLLFLSVAIFFSAHVTIPAFIKTSILGLSLFVFFTFFLIFVFYTPVLLGLLRLVTWADHKGYKKIEKLFIFLADFFKRLTDMLGVKHFVYVFLLSLFVWAFEAGLFLAILQGLHFSINPIDAIGIMAITTLATLVPSSPGYVGPFHLAAYAALAALDVSVSSAASFAVLTHLALWLPTTLVGVVAILYNRQLFQVINIQEQNA
jgi:uncharacterized protein (TIRG00374 family)